MKKCSDGSYSGEFPKNVQKQSESFECKLSWAVILRYEWVWHSVNFAFTVININGCVIVIIRNEGGCVVTVVGIGELYLVKSQLCISDMLFSIHKFDEPSMKNSRVRWLSYSWNIFTKRCRCRSIHMSSPSKVDWFEITTEYSRSTFAYLTRGPRRHGKFWKKIISTSVLRYNKRNTYSISKYK